MLRAKIRDRRAPLGASPRAFAHCGVATVVVRDLEHPAAREVELPQPGRARPPTAVSRSTAASRMAAGEAEGEDFGEPQPQPQPRLDRISTLEG